MNPADRHHGFDKIESEFPIKSPMAFSTQPARRLIPVVRVWHYGGLGVCVSNNPERGRAPESNC